MDITINNTSNITINSTTSLADLVKALGNVEEQAKTPTSKKLRETAGSPVAEEGGCLVYPNGYCVYTNCTGSTVMFVPGCRSFTYKFNGLTDSEIGILTDHQDITEEAFCALPWYIALMVRGDHRIEYNSFNRAGDRKRERQEDDEDDEKETEKKAYRYNPGYHFESPEDAYIRKETIREALSKLTEKQKEVYLLYHRDGYTEDEIAEMLGINQTSVRDRLRYANQKVSKKIENLF
ncbi:MAG: sigma-70 family RNA polymerase sigma factor [Blautia sp.]|nr:sigma-70 family RNA polymerase sigma factor [Blautia sp.]